VIHQGLIYRSEDEFVSVVAPFLREAVDASQPALAILTPARREPLSSALGRAADAVRFVDATDWYVRPGAALFGLSSAVTDGLAAGASFVRVAGEPPFVVDVDRVERWARYESILNRLHPAEFPASVLCVYDGAALPEDALLTCARTHPTLVSTEGNVPSPEFFSHPDLGAGFTPLRPDDAEELSAARADSADELIVVRRAVVQPAQQAGISISDSHDLALAVDELARAAFAHDCSPVAARTASSGSDWWCELAITKCDAAVLASDRARLALAVASVVSTSIELGENAEGNVVRFVLRRPKATPRSRILAAATEIYGSAGVQRATVNEIAAHARVAKATFYSTFPSKTDLLTTWLSETGSGWFDDLRAEVEARGSTPRERLHVWLDVFADWIERDVAIGTPMLSVANELRDPRHPAHDGQARVMARLSDYLHATAEEAGVDDPERVTSELLLLMQGAATRAAALRSADPARIAAAAGQRLLAQA
jgi:AcrR family transcriptional regulator